MSACPGPNARAANGWFIFLGISPWASLDHSVGSSSVSPQPFRGAVLRKHHDPLIIVTSRQILVQISSPTWIEAFFKRWQPPIYMIYNLKESFQDPPLVPILTPDLTILIQDFNKKGEKSAYTRLIEKEKGELWGWLWEHIWFLLIPEQVMLRTRGDWRNVKFPRLSRFPKPNWHSIALFLLHNFFNDFSRDQSDSA